MYHVELNGHILYTHETLKECKRETEFIKNFIQKYNYYPISLHQRIEAEEIYNFCISMEPIKILLEEKNDK